MLAEHTFICRTRAVEVRKIFKQMKTGKATGPYDIPIELENSYEKFGGIR